MPRPPGTYTLLLGIDQPRTLAVGALDEQRFRPGAYAYTGSAFGPGGLARVDRHRQLATTDDGRRHWHVDYLLPLATLADVFTAAGHAAECAVARSLPGDPVPGFGASDCGCGSHLSYDPDVDALRSALEGLYADPAAIDG